MDPQLFDSLRLIRSYRVGPATYHRLIDEHGSARGALNALPGIAAKAGVPKYSAYSVEAAEAECKVAQKAGAKPLLFGRRNFPVAFKTLEDPPPFLWATGDIELLQRPAIAIVGARNASSLGTRMARSLAADAGKAGYVVVSGLARGIDAAAQDAALEQGTISVMAGGVDMLYPPENRGLYDAIRVKGLILSEQPMGLSPQARHFPRRNRLISGLSQGVVVVEAALKSGSMITARDAVDQGREVFAVPGHPLDPRASGCNALLRDGARLTRDFSDISSELGTPTPGTFTQTKFTFNAPTPNRPCNSAPATEIDPQNIRASILEALSPSPVSEDDLIQTLGQPVSLVSRTLTHLEIDGLLTRQSGGMLARVV